MVKKLVDLAARSVDQSDAQILKPPAPSVARLTPMRASASGRSAAAERTSRRPADGRSHLRLGPGALAPSDALTAPKAELLALKHSVAELGAIGRNVNQLVRLAHQEVEPLIFSMPAGTPADKALATVRIFAREEFGLKHRYAMVLHTDEPHPHAHAVVKAVSEDGVRLNIRKATLRAWRQEFARHLREHGITANATERAVRGEPRTRKTDGIYRAALRGASTYMRKRMREVATCLVESRLPVEQGNGRLIATRRNVEQGWLAVARLLDSQGEQYLAQSAKRFVDGMRSPRMDKEIAFLFEFSGAAPSCRSGACLRSPPAACSPLMA
jgi:Relaxase/Mobilisation nuclease domain